MILFFCIEHVIMFAGRINKSIFFHRPTHPTHCNLISSSPIIISTFRLASTKIKLEALGYCILVFQETSILLIHFTLIHNLGQDIPLRGI